MSKGDYKRPNLEVLIFPLNVEPDTLTFHVKTRLSELRDKKFLYPLTYVEENYFEDIGEIGTVIVEYFNEIDGVDHIYLGMYELTVVKSPVYKWDDLLPDIFKAIQLGTKRELNVINMRELPGKSGKGYKHNKGDGR